MSLKRKASGGDGDRMKRLRDAVQQFTEDNAGTWTALHGKSSQSGTKSKKPMAKSLTRKQQRKQDRQLKKMRKAAFTQHKPLPTAKSVQKEKDDKVKEEKRLKAKEKKKRKDKKRKKMKKERAKEEEESKVSGLKEANKKEDKMISQLEKQLKLKRRKSKTLPLAFRNDGLDYLLEAVDPEKLKAIYDNEGEDLKGDIFKDSGDEFEESASDEDFSDVEGEEDEDDKDDEDSETRDFDDLESDFSSGDEGQEKDVSEGDLQQKAKVKGILKSDKIKPGLKPQGEVGKGKTGGSSQRVSFDDPEMDDPDGNNLDSESTEDEEDDLDEEDFGEEEYDDDVGDFNAQDSESNVKNTLKSKVKEDIYGRLRDSDGNVLESKAPSVGAYVPPGRRAALAGTVDEKRRLQLERMRKQLKGLMNRLSEANVQPISGEIEEMFRLNSRAETCEALVEVVMAACVSPTLTPDRLVSEHVLLVAILHANVGSEVGAYFLTKVAQRYEALSLEANQGSGKEIDNVLTLLANLYNFRVVHSLLIVDIIKRLISDFGEKDIELLLVILRHVGFSLRKDDPDALKEVIIDIQKKASSVDTARFQDQSRVKFMLEILMAIKNNNMRKIPNFDPGHLEHLRKLLRMYATGSSSADSQLRISLEDLLKADEHGRWWLVGSAWTGRDTDSSAVTRTAGKMVDEVSSTILELARKQRMNTEVRKNIFCIIMTSEDFVDAFEKLLRLGLKHKQEREIIHVITDLCVQEKTFNPFYGCLAQKFCEYDRRFQMTAQFHLWDRFKNLSDLPEQKLSNLGSFLIHLIASKAVSLSVFKVIEFGELDKAKVRFMKKVLQGLLVDHPDYVTRETFARVAPFPKLGTMREGLRLFMRHFLLRNKGKVIDNKSDDFRLLEERVTMAERSLSSSESQVRL